MADAPGDDETAQHEKERDAVITNRTKPCSALEKRVGGFGQHVAAMGDVKPGHGKSGKPAQHLERLDAVCGLHNADRLNSCLARSPGISIQWKDTKAQARIASRLSGKRPLTVVFQVVRNGCCQR